VADAAVAEVFLYDGMMDTGFVHQIYAKQRNRSRLWSPLGRFGPA
jgi:hypothetical protein